jgi:hypothetical protein
VVTAPDVLVAGLRVLAGKAVDTDLMERLKELMKSDLANIRWYTAEVLGRDTNAATAVEKANVINDSMKTTLGCKDAQQRVGVGHAWFDNRFPMGEYSLDSQAWDLAKMNGLPPGWLAARPLPEAGPVRDFLILARARAHDETAQADLRQVLTNSTSVLARMMALDLVFKNGTPEDLAAVRAVAEEDPLQAMPTGRYYDQPWADHSLEKKPHPTIYPLRLMAEQRLKEAKGESIRML